MFRGLSRKMDDYLANVPVTTSRRSLFLLLQMSCTEKVERNAYRMGDA